MREIFDAQRAAFLRAETPSLQERRADLTRLNGAISRNVGRLAEAISADFGNRSRHETELAEIVPVQSAIRHTLRHLARWMQPKRVSVGLELMPATARILYQPVGVVGIISPWNYPFNLAIVPLVAALAAGNRVMLKPSEITPRTSDFLSEFLADLFPPDKVATIVGGPEIGQAFARLPFDHLLYTGSTTVGRLVMQAAAENLTPVTLELGGKSPCILGEDAALPSAVESIVYGKLLNAGQTCIAPDYVLLPERNLDEFVKLTVDTTKKFYPKLATNPDYTSIINDRHYRRVTQYVAEAKASGARVVEINPRQETATGRSAQNAADAGDRAWRKPGPHARGDLRAGTADQDLPRTSTRPSITSTATRAHSHSITLALMQRAATRFCARQFPVAPRSTRPSFTSSPKICRLAASAPRGLAPITASLASRPSRIARAFSSRAGSAARAFFIPPFGRITNLMLKFLRRG